MQIHQPHPALRPFISHYWLSHTPQGAVHPILPDGCVDVVFELGTTTAARVYGVATQRSSCAIAAGYHYLGICFRPGQLRRFMDVPAVLLADRCEALDMLAGLQPQLLADQLQGKAVFAYLDSVLSRRLADRVTALEAVDGALHSIDRHHGNIRIDAVAAAANLSRRQLERRFLDQVGMSPKTYAAIRRMQRVLSTMAAAPQLSLAALALDAGYADQSHMNRSFRRLLQQTPRAAVAFVQDQQLPADYSARTN